MSDVAPGQEAKGEDPAGTLKGPSAPGRGEAKSFGEWSGPQGSASLSDALRIPSKAVIWDV